MHTRRAGDVSQPRVVRPYRDRHERSAGRGGTFAVASAQEAGQARPRARAVLAVTPARSARRRAAGVPDPPPADVPLAGPQCVERHGLRGHEPAVDARILERDQVVVANPGLPVDAEHGSAVLRGEVELIAQWGTALLLLQTHSSPFSTGTGVKLPVGNRRSLRSILANAASTRSTPSLSASLVR